MNVGIILLLLLSIGSLAHSNEFDPEQPIESANSSFSSEESDSPNDLNPVARKPWTAPKEYNRFPKIWFKFQLKQLLQLKLLFDWHIRTPILKEQIYFDHNFLLHMKWIHQNDSLEHGLQYFDRSGNLLEPVRGPLEELSQTFVYDPLRLGPEDDFMESVLRNNPKSKENVIRIGNYLPFLGCIPFLYPLRMRSHNYKTGPWPANTGYYTEEFTDHPFRAKDEVLVGGTFAELAKLSYNEYFSNLSTTKIWVGRGILDWHWQKEDEMDLFNYETSNEYFYESTVASLSSKIPWYLDSYDYFKHIGRFRRFPENAWLMFLNVKNRKGKFYRPYRLIDQNSHLQKENNFYAVPKSKVRQFFNLTKGDDGYLEIFKKVESEKKDANEVWLSDRLLDYLKTLSPNVPDLQDYEKKLKKKSYKKMVKQMCKVDESHLTRIITLHIVQDYSVFIDGRRWFQWGFSSQQILRWTCYSLNEDDCMYKTYSVVCRYLRKNHPAKWVETERRLYSPVSWEPYDLN